MKTGTLALTLSAATALVACEQPTNTCQTQRGAFAVVLTPKAGSGQCLGGQKLEVINLQNYSPTAPGSDPPERDVTVPPNLAVQTYTIGGLRGFAEEIGVPDEDTAHTAYSLGKFTSLDPKNELCTVPTLTAAHYVTGEIAPTTCGGSGGGGAAAGGGGAGGDTSGAGGAGGCIEDPGFPKTDITVEWKNIQMLVRPDAPGTQLKGEVTYTIDGCKDEYTAIGVYPAVDCGVYDGETGALTGIDAAACLPDPAPEEGRPYGSGLNPDFPIVCMPDEVFQSAYCVIDPARSFPAINNKK